MTNNFVLRTDLDRERCLKAVNAAPLDPPTAVEIAPYRKKRSRRQENRHFEMLSQIAEQVRDEDGKLHSKETWHYHFAGEFLGVVVIVIGGVERVYPRSSRDLTTAEYAEWDDQIEAWAAGRGVTLVFDADSY